MYACICLSLLSKLYYRSSHNNEIGCALIGICDFWCLIFASFASKNETPEAKKYHADVGENAQERQSYKIQTNLHTQEIVTLHIHHSAFL